ncbi:hypothetical protein LZG00_20775 [Rhodobacteraceae bacterium LMO-12]|nr:hypothetical protein [Rhodobacteraceae bacterium LMO-JJ12]
MPNIDLSRIITADQRAAQAETARVTRLRNACRSQILSVCSQSRQINLAAAAASGRLSETDQKAYVALVDWIAAMRAACAASIKDAESTRQWPPAPDKAVKLCAAF